MRSLYSIIWEFKGGTFVDQIEADSAQKAFSIWIEEKKADNNSVFNEEDKKELKRIDLDIDSPILLKNMVNIWCSDYIINNEYVSVIIVKTEKR